MNHTNVTLKDIARATGYSLLSVHRAVHNKEGISEETRVKILKVVKDMGYKVNYSAASLKRKKLVFGFVSRAPSLQGDYYDVLLHGTEAVIAEKSGLNCELQTFLFEAGEDVEKNELALLNQIIHDSVHTLDGLVVVPICTTSAIAKKLNHIIAQGIPVVTIDNKFPEMATVCSVASDCSPIGELAAEFLTCIHLPKGKILIATGKENSAIHRENTRGFINYLTENQPKCQILALEDGKNAEDFYQKARKVLRDNPDIVALYSVRERNTIPLCRALIDLHREGNVTCIGSDLLPENMDMLEQGVITAILNKNPYQRGYVAMDALTDLLIKNITPHKELTVPINIILKTNLSFYKKRQSNK